MNAVTVCSNAFFKLVLSVADYASIYLPKLYICSLYVCLNALNYGMASIKNRTQAKRQSRESKINKYEVKANLRQIRK